MAIESLAILSATQEGNDFLAHKTGATIANIQKKSITTSLKNTDLSGDPESGSVEAKRFANAVPQDYGTARAAGKGTNVKAKSVVVLIDQDKEIVEELEAKDVKLYGVEGLVEKRIANHPDRVIAAMERDFMTVAAEAASKIEIPAGMAIDDELELAIQTLETVNNEYVDGVPRELMELVCSPNVYGKVRNNLDKQVRSNVDTSEEEFYAWHGVETKSCNRLPAGVRYILMVKGAVAQPVYMSRYASNKIPLSEAYSLELYYHYGTKAVTPDLIFTPEEQA